MLNYTFQTLLTSYGQPYCPSTNNYYANLNFFESFQYLLYHPKRLHAQIHLESFCRLFYLANQTSTASGFCNRNQQKMVCSNFLEGERNNGFRLLETPK